MNGRPDWVMCGVPCLDGRVCIIASTELSQVELEALHERLDSVDFFDLIDAVRLSPMRYRLTVEMERFVIIYADTYAHAFQTLFEAVDAGVHVHESNLHSRRRRRSRGDLPFVPDRRCHGGAYVSRTLPWRHVVRLPTPDGTVHVSLRTFLLRWLSVRRSGR